MTSAYMTEEDIDDQLMKSLEKLQTDYIDLLLIHFPIQIMVSAKTVHRNRL